MTDTRNAAPVRGGDELERYDDIDRRLGVLLRNLGASERRYPALIRTDVLVRAEYERAFPHLLFMAGRIADPESVGTCSSALERPTATGWCLSPAVCYHVYAQYCGTVRRHPAIVTASGKCFRNETAHELGIRQLEFDMREVVVLGPPEWVHAQVRSIARTIVTLARELGVRGRWRPAADPFFLPIARGKALTQRLSRVKYEYQTSNGLALVSVNRHRTFFGERFQIHGGHGEPVHSACIAVGLDRLAHASLELNGHDHSVEEPVA